MGGFWNGLEFTEVMTNTNITAEISPVPIYSIILSDEIVAQIKWSMEEDVG